MRYTNTCLIYFITNVICTRVEYYGSFNNIRSVVGRQVNEIMVLHLIKSHCLPRLMYGCEIWPLNAVNVREIDILWNNGFRHVFNCCWQESVKPLQFYCHTLPLSYQLHERQLLFYRRLLLSDNIVLRTLAGLPRVRFEMLGIAAKYNVDNLNYSTETVKNAVWLSFVNNITF